MRAAWRRKTRWFDSTFTVLLIALLRNISLAADAQWAVRTWQIPDGSANTVTGIVQSPDGYLWISTTAGLNQFDGLHFQHHNLAAPSRLPESRVRVLLYSRAGDLWTVLDGAVARLRQGAAPLMIQDGVPAARAEHIIEDTDGAMWITYRNGQACRIQNGTAITLGADNGIPAGGRLSFALDSDGKLWFAKGTHVGVVTIARFDDIFQAPSACCIASARTGGLWVCTDGKLFRYTQSRGLTAITTMPVKQINEPLTLLEDRESTLWIGTASAGLFHCDGSKVELVPTPQASITCLMEDRESNVWAGSDAGLDRITPRIVKAEGVEEGLPLGAVGSICQGPDKQIWASTTSGALMMRTNNHWTPTAVPLRIGVTCVTCDSTGTLWFGMRNRSLCCWSMGALTTWTSKDGLSNHEITSVYVSRTGDVWIGSTDLDHVQRFRDGKFETISTPRGNGQVAAIVEDSKGTIWMGRTFRGGLFKIKEGQLTAVTPLDQYSPIHALHVTADDSLWIAFYGRGLGRIKDGRLTLITTAQGLSDDHLSQIVSDDHGCLWFGGDEGIFKASRSDLDLAADGKLARIHCVRYAGDEGLPALQAKYRVGSSSLRSADGQLWMTMATVLAVINPDRVRERSEAAAGVRATRLD